MKTAAPEQKSVKTLKGQLFGAVAMMLVAAIALGTSTYAWFVNNQTVQVDPMKLTVSTSTSLTVAVGKADAFDTASVLATKFTGYKTLLTNPDITGVGAASGADVADWSKMLDNELVPASITSANLPAANFFMSNGHLDSDSKLDEFLPLNSGTGDSDAGQGPVKIIPLRFLTSSDIDVYFGRADRSGSGGLSALEDIADLITSAATHDGLSENDMNNQRDAIRQALRVAIVPKAIDGEDTAPAPVIFQFDNGNGPHIVGAVNNTKYQSGGPTVTANEATGLYAAIASLAGNDPVNTRAHRLVKMDGAQNTAYTGGTGNYAAEKYIAEVKVDTANGGADIVNVYTDTNKPLFTMNANVPRDVNVYIWLEGTDQDCVSTLSSFQFNLDLPFAAGKATETKPTTP